MARQKVIDVVPSNMSGMAFEARDELFDHQVNILVCLFLFLCISKFKAMELLEWLTNINTVVLRHVRIRTHYPGEKERTDL